MKYNYAKLNDTELKDIYKLPKLMKELLDSRSAATVFYGVEGDVGSDTVQKASYMLERISEYAYSMYDTDGSLYLYTSIIPMDGNKTILGIYVSRSGENTASTLDEEEKMNIDLILDELFGYGSGL